MSSTWTHGSRQPDRIDCARGQLPDCRSASRQRALRHRLRHFSNVWRGRRRCFGAAPPRDAGKYTGKDDPVAIVRNQGIFRRPGREFLPFAKAHFVGWRCARLACDAADACATEHAGDRHVPPANRSCVGFSIEKSAAAFRVLYTDFFRTTRRGTRSAGAPSARPSRCAARAGLAPRCDPIPQLEHGGFRRHRVRAASVFGCTRTASRKWPSSGNYASIRRHDCAAVSCLSCLTHSDHSLDSCLYG